MIQFLWPLADSRTTRNFYFRSSLYVGGQHDATDRVKALAPTLGANLIAPADSMIIGDAWDPYSGYFVAGRTADGWIWFVRHLIADSPLVRGQLVKQGQVIGRVGSTGASSGPHAHCDWWNEEKRSPEAVYKNGWWAHDPELYLGKEVQDDMTVVLAYPNYGGRWVLVDGYWKHPLTAAAFQALTSAKQVALVTLPKVTIDAIPNSA